jgi:pimeloyl-ACP methyl ester carboxylesterase
VVVAGDPARPAVVLVHGIGSSSGYFRRLVRALAADWWVLAPDLPGHGSSPQPPRPLSVAEHAEVLGALLVERGLVGDRAPVLLGHSMGAQIIAALLSGTPGAARRAVLVGPTVDDRARSVLRQARRLWWNAAREPTSLVPVQLWAYLQCGPRTYAATLRHILTDRVEDHLRAVLVPVVLVRGARDPVARRPWVDRLRAGSPTTTAVEVPHGHHVVHWSHAGVVAAVCAGDLSAVRAVPAP